MEKRFLGIFLPHWSVDLERRRRQPTRAPLLLLSPSGGTSIVKRCCAQSLLAGVRCGMTFALARAIVPQALAVRWNPQQDLRQLYKLAVRLLRLAPHIAIDHELVIAQREGRLVDATPLANGVLLDITGTRRLYRDERRLLRSIEKRFTSLRIAVRCAIAPSSAAAWALTRFGAANLIIERTGDLPAALARLPIRALRLDEAVYEALEALGISTIGDLMKLPRSALATRFGLDVICRLDQALGIADERLYYIHPRKLFKRSADFETPLVDHESIQHATLALFAALVDDLTNNDKHAGYFQISMGGFALAQPIEREISLNAAGATRTQLLSILIPLVENIHAPNGIRTITITARTIETVHAEQENFLTSPLTATQSAIRELVNNLTVRLGADRITTLTRRASHIPERSFFLEKIQPHFKSPAEVTLPRNSSEEISERPFVLLPQPQPITVIALLPDRPPSWIRWKGGNGAVLQASGPERIAEEWWREISRAEALIDGTLAEATRDYFRLQDFHGQWLWVFRENRSQRWFLHGLWS